INKSIACVKAYTTRVGEGPFPTEFSSVLMDQIRKKGNEFGATTGRPRRCGWFDSVLARYSMIINGISELAIMKLDVLDDLKEIQICTAYKYKGETFKEFPMDYEKLCGVKPVYEKVPGWNSSTYGLKNYAELPKNAKSYIDRLEKLLKVGVKYISTGPKRDEIIVR
ncbi:MAG: adenylosuccinate synthetase, partial [Candidatus Omnitrophica bacterium]|nr:adenylosuccinate synthetase [Candidatus Omnitrophota bacterium]